MRIIVSEKQAYVIVKDYKCTCNAFFPHFIYMTYIFCHIHTKLRKVDSLCANPFAQSPGQVKLDSDK